MQDIRIKGVISFCIILSVIVIDYSSKQYALLFDQNYILNSFITIYRMNNYGIAFSLFNNLDYLGQWILNILIFLILAFIAKELFTNLASSILYLIGLSLILGGGLANFVDRYDNSAVTDFIILHYNDIYFPAVFNIADLSICMGALLIIIYFMSNKKNEVY
jgi:signal peptidase II